MKIFVQAQILCLLVLAVWPGLLMGQAKLVRTQGSGPSDNVHCSLQDSAGNLWFGTTGEGVYRYDGKAFVQFSLKEGLSANAVWCMLEDQAGSIWFGTAAGLCRYDGKAISRVPISQSEDSPTHRNEVFSLLQDPEGVIWLGTTNGVYRYDGRSFSPFLSDLGMLNMKGLSLKSVQCMLQDGQGNIWFGSGPMAFEGICRYDGRALTSFKPREEGWIRNILQDKKGNLWFGTRSHGACRYDGTGFSFFTEKEGIGNPMLQDQAGNIWFAGGEKTGTIESEGGIWSYDGQSFRNYGSSEGLAITLYGA